MKRARYYLLFCFILPLLTTSVFAQAPQKLRIAVLDFNNTGGLSGPETVTLGNRLRSMLVQTDAYVVIERGKMEEILKEQGFQQTGCTTTECAVEVGRLLNVQKMVSGSIGKVGATYTIDLSLIDIATAQIEQSFFRDYQGRIDGLLEIMQVIANQIADVSSAPGKKPEPPAEKPLFTLSVNSIPDGAEVLLNGRRAGETPYQSRAREGVELEIRIKKENFQDWVRRITVTEDVDINSRLEFTDAYKEQLARAGKQPPGDGSSNTWLWIGGGAALLGGAAVLILSGGGGNGDQPAADSFPRPPGRPD